MFCCPAVSIFPSALAPQATGEAAARVFLNTRLFQRQKLTHSINAGQALTETRKLLAEARDRLQQREGELTELQTALQDAVRQGHCADEQHSRQQ